MRELVRRLAYEIEDARIPLHRDRGFSDRCKRLQMGLASTKPKNCDGGLDDLLAEPHAFTANGSR